MRISASGNSSATPSRTVPASKLTNTPLSLAFLAAARAPIGLCPSMWRIFAPAIMSVLTSEASSSFMFPRVHATLRLPVGSSIQQYAIGDSQPRRTVMKSVHTFSDLKSRTILLPASSSPIAVKNADFIPKRAAATVEFPAGPPPCTICLDILTLLSIGILGRRLR